MAGAHMAHGPVLQDSGLDTLGLEAIRDFLKKRAHYLRLEAQNNKAGGFIITMITFCGFD
jgi:hypothetical protein